MLLAAIGVAMLAACADQSTSPAAPLAPRASNAGPFDVQSSGATLGWEGIARGLVIAHPTLPAIAATRAYALMAVGAYGAVVAADDAEGTGGGGRALYEARRGAVAGASAGILEYLFPDAAAALEDSVASKGSAGPGQTHPHFTRGVAIGRAMAARMVAWGRADGFSTPWNGLAMPDLLHGGWVGAAGAAPAGFQFPTMTPYYLSAAASPFGTAQSQFRPAPPFARGTPEFDADLAAVRTTAATRGPTEVGIANFWNLGGGTESALGYWDERAADYIGAAGMDERDASHVLALVNSAALDAVIGCWEAKYHYMRLRPSMADASITRPQGPPGFPYTLPNHPSYPSGHSCTSAAAAEVIASFFPERAATLDAMVAQAGLSRVIGGIHYPSDVTVGQALGRAAARWAIARDHGAGGLLSALDR